MLIFSREQFMCCYLAWDCFLSQNNFFSPSLRSNRPLQPFWALRPSRQVCVESGDLDTTLSSDPPSCEIHIAVHEVLPVRHWIMQSSLDRFLRIRQATAESNCGEEEQCQEKEPKTTEAAEDSSSRKRYEKKEEKWGQNTSTGVEGNICVASLRQD